MMDISENDIDLQVVKILMVDNKMADLLSRWHINHQPGKLIFFPKSKHS